MSNSNKMPHLDGEQRKKLRNLIGEATDSKLRQAAEYELQKDIRSRAKDELGIPAKLFTQAVKVAYDHSADEYEAERDAVLEMAEIAGVHSTDDE